MGVVMHHGGRDYHFGCVEENSRSMFAPHAFPVAPLDSEELEGIPCEICGEMVAFEAYAAHAAGHSSRPPVAPKLERDENFIPCEECGRLVPYEEYGVHQAMHNDLGTALQRKQLFNEPDGIALLILEIVREASTSLPDSFDTAREICNFDVAVPFVRKMLSFCRQLGVAAAQPEIVYHWTKKEHIQSIVENNLKAPGEVNVDGSNVKTVHGAVYGKGIYAATDMSYGKAYGYGTPSALLCLALPGSIQKGGKLTNGCDSLQGGALRVYADSSQLLPLFLTNSGNEQQVRKVAKQVAELLVSQLRESDVKERGRCVLSAPIACRWT